MNNSSAANGHPVTLAAPTKDTNMNTIHPNPPVPTATITSALALINNAELSDLLNVADRPARSLLSQRQILAAWIALALEGRELTAANVSNLLFDRLTPKTREILGLPEAFAARTRQQISRGVRNATADLLDTMDAFPLPDRRGRLTKSEWDQVVADRALHAEELESKRRRFLAFANNLLHAQFAALPTEMRDGTFHATIDSRFRPAGAAGIPARRVAALGPDDRVSAEPDAAMYASARTTGTQYGWDDELVVLHPAVPGAAPCITIGFNSHRPGADFARHAAEALQRLASRGLALGHVVVDRAYMAARPDYLRAGLDDLRAKVIGDYSLHQLGVQDAAGNAILVEGTWYCASMPKHLQQGVFEARRAQATHSAGGAAEKAFVDALIAARATYALAPEAGSAGLPETSRLEQALPYRSPEWKTAYAAGRNAMEYYLTELRHTAALRGGAPGLRGATGNAFLSLLDIIATNARIINEFTARATATDGPRRAHRTAMV